MKKSGKILFVSILIVMFMFAFSNFVKAADEIEYTGSDDGYEELGTGTEGEGQTQQQSQEPTSPSAAEQQKIEDTSKKEEQNNKTNSTTNAVEPTNNTNTSTEAHAKAGDFKATFYIVGTAVIGFALIVGYAKFKKYNF